MTNTIKPKQIELKRIANRDARKIILARYRSGSFPSGIMLSLGAFVDGRCYGCIVFANGSRFIHTVIDNGRQGDVWELVRLWLSDELPKNSESRLLRIAIKLVKQFNPALKAIVTYTELGVGLYKGAGWKQVPGRFGDRVMRVVDGVEHYSSRAVSSQYGTLSKKELEKRGHRVELREGKHRTKWIYWIVEGKLAQDAIDEKHPFENQVVALWRQSPKWLGWPGSHSIREALYDEAYVAEFENGKMVGCWLFRRLKKSNVLRDLGCCVDESMRRKGIGRKLVEQAKQICEKENRVLTFDCKSENPNIEFWRQMKFDETGKRKRGKSQESYCRFVYVPEASKVAPEASGRCDHQAR